MLSFLSQKETTQIISATEAQPPASLERLKEELVVGEVGSVFGLIEYAGGT